MTMSEQELEFDTDTTEGCLRSMFTENTGRHMLDSGGAYGRHWEKNQETPPWDKPAVVIESDYVTFNAYHFLVNLDGFERSNRSIQLEEQFYQWCNDDGVSPYHPGQMEHWAEEELGAARIHGRGSPTTVNNYNGEDFLSQTLQYVVFTLGTDMYIMLQVRGGCDVRGGYTRPRIFESKWDYFPSATDCIYNCAGCDHEVYHYSGHEELEFHEGELGPPGEDGWIECPRCGSEMKVWGG